MKEFLSKIYFRFNQLNCREKLFLLLFVWLLNFVFLEICIKQTNSLLHHLKFINAKVKNCQYWIKNTSSIDEKFEKMIMIMDPQKTYSGASFAGEVEKAIRESGIDYSMSSPKTRQGEIFDSHTLQLHCTNASLQRLITFEDAIYKKKPYLSMEKVKIHANLFNPELLEVDFSLSALQLKDLKNEK